MKTTAILALPYPESTDSADVPRDIKALAEKLDPPGGGNGAFIIGEIRFVAVAAMPAGWLVADGRAVSRATYAALFAAIASVFGPGDGSTTFNLPDCRGRGIVGAGQGTGLSNRAVGTKWGVEAVVLSGAQMPSHNHGGGVHAHTFEGHVAGAAAVMQGAYPEGVNALPPYTGGAAWNYRPIANSAAIVSPNGNDQAHDNTSPSIAVPAYIYSGV